MNELNDFFGGNVRVDTGYINSDEEYLFWDIRGFNKINEIRGVFGVRCILVNVCERVKFRGADVMV